MRNKTIIQKANNIYFSLNDDVIRQQELSNYFYDLYLFNNIRDYKFFRTYNKSNSIKLNCIEVVNNDRSTFTIRFNKKYLRKDKLKLLLN